jgi:predicted enzyme related to lactoylglutathione lyase
VEISHLFGGIPTADFPTALAWYERLFGRPPDNRPKADEAVWQVVDQGLIYVVRDPARAGAGLVTLIVNDLDRSIGELKGRGIEVGPVESVTATTRRAVVRDLDGNSIALGQVS